LNYLAHAYLSFKNPEILVGNLISDFVKGKKKFNYPVEIQKGIALHRMIDEFTDNHQATSLAKVFFKPAYGLYAGAFMDIVYDHFLANDPKEFHNANELQYFAQHTYKQLAPYENIFPEKFRMMFYYMQSQNWLYNYQFKKGIHSSFIGMVRRAKFIRDAQPAFSIFENHYEELKKCYQTFFPDIKNFAYTQLQLLNNPDQKNPDINESF
jgi:acyl carrier protein phosphodiesterase